MLNASPKSAKPGKPWHTFSGNIFIFHAFDVGDEISLEKVKESGALTTKPTLQSKYFKDYHVPLTVIPPQKTDNCISTKIHNFGALSFTYKIPFNETLDHLKANLLAIDEQFQQQSVNDAGVIFRKIKPYTTKPTFFLTRSSYVVIQVDTKPKEIGTITLKNEYGNTIASTLRFETKALSEYQKNEILASAIGYFRGDLIVIDTEAAFIYDAEYKEILDLFEFANINQLELRFFDRLLDNQLTLIYEGKTRKPRLKTYLPFIGVLTKSPIGELGKLKVDISVITERLEGNIMLTGEPYIAELYSLLIEKLGLQKLKEAIDKKLSIVHDTRSVLQNKIDTIREDMLTILIIILIFIELLIAWMK